MVKTCTMKEVAKLFKFFAFGVHNVTCPRFTLGSAYDEVGYNKHPTTTSRFLCIIIIDSNVKMFGYYEHPPTMSSFLCIYLLVLNGDSVYKLTDNGEKVEFN